MRGFQYVLALAVALGCGLAVADDGDKAPPVKAWWISEAPQEKDRPKVAAKVEVKVEQLRVAGKAQADGDKPASGKLIRQKLQAIRPEAKPVAKPAIQKTDAAPAQRRVYAYAYDGPKKPPAKPRERLVYRLSNMPAMDIARTVEEILRNEQRAAGKDAPAGTMVVMPEVVSNSIILSGPSDEIHKTAKLIEQLDAEPMMVSVHVVLALVEAGHGISLLGPDADGPVLSCSHQEACELLEKYADSDAVKILAQPQLMTLDNQSAFLQIGQRVPSVALRNTKDGQLFTTEMNNVGLILGLTPRISPDHVITMEIDLEKSEVGPESEGVPIGVDAQGNVIRAPRIDVMSLQTTVNIPSSRAVIIGGMALKDGDDEGELVMVVTPHVVARKK